MITCITLSCVAANLAHCSHTFYIVKLFPAGLCLFYCVCTTVSSHPGKMPTWRQKYRFLNITLDLTPTRNSVVNRSFLACRPDGCTSLAAWLSGYDVGLWLADFPRSTPDLWLTCDHFVGKVSAMGQPTRPTQPSILRGRYKMSSNTIKRQTRAAYGCLIAGQSLWTHVHPTVYRLYVRSVYDMNIAY